MRLIVFISALFLASFALAQGQQDISANGNYFTVFCDSGKGRWASYDGGSGYDSGTVTFQYYAGWGEWENPCSTATDCQASSGNSGVKPFDLGMAAQVRLNLAGVSSDSDIDAELSCADSEEVYEDLP